MQTSHIAPIGPYLLQEGAYADVEVKLGLIKLLHKEFDLCQEAYAFEILAV
jgi:hypothetical protein